MEEVEIREFRHGRYYNMFFATGMAALLICGGLMIYIISKKY